MSSINPVNYDLEEVKKEWIGKLVGDAKGKYPVEYDPIRRHCHMNGDANPAFLDPEIAKNGPHGSVIVPPSMLLTMFASGGAWPPAQKSDSDRPVFTFGVPTPGDRGMNMEVDWTFLEPVRIGDMLRLELRISDIFKKSIRFDEHAIWIVTETSFFNQDETVVATWHNTVLVHRSPEHIQQHMAEDQSRVNTGEAS